MAFQLERPNPARADEIDRLWGVPVPQLPPRSVGIELAGPNGLDLTVAPGEFVGVVGGSGSGKSALLRLLAGRERAQLLESTPRLAPWRRVYGNVARGLPGRAVHETVMEALARVGLFERAREWPARLTDEQRQRVALACALVSNPPLLLLDEPPDALLPLIERLQAVRGFTAVLATRDIEAALAVCDRVVSLESSPPPNGAGRSPAPAPGRS